MNNWVDKKGLNKLFPIFTKSRLDQLVWKREIPFTQFSPRGKVYFNVQRIEQWLNKKSISIR